MTNPSGHVNVLMQNGFEMACRPDAWELIERARAAGDIWAECVGTCGETLLVRIRDVSVVVHWTPEAKERREAVRLTEPSGGE